MNEREKIIQRWFDMWLEQQDFGIDEIFTEDVLYTESWSPQYCNRKTVKHWFQEWNTRGKVVKHIPIAIAMSISRVRSCAGMCREKHQDITYLFGLLGFPPRHGARNSFSKTSGQHPEGR